MEWHGKWRHGKLRFNSTHQNQTPVKLFLPAIATNRTPCDSCTYCNTYTAKFSFEYLVEQVFWMLRFTNFNVHGNTTHTAVSYQYQLRIYRYFHNWSKLGSFEQDYRNQRRLYLNINVMANIFQPFFIVELQHFTPKKMKLTNSGSKLSRPFVINIGAVMNIENKCQNESKCHSNGKLATRIYHFTFCFWHVSYSEFFISWEPEKFHVVMATGTSVAQQNKSKADFTQWLFSWVNNYTSET